MPHFNYTVQQFIKKGGLSFLLVALLIFIILKKDVNIDFSLTAPQASATLVETEQGERENKEPSVLSSLFPKSRESFKNELEHLSEKKQLNYINRFGHVAKKEMKKYGIPASIIVASGLLHSQAGEAPLAKKGVNNHFAVPCTDDWKDSSKEYKGRCFRRYDNAWMSFRNHSIFITSERFPVTQNIDAKDYRAWAKALEQTKYSPYSNLSANLIQIINRYNLTVLDKV